MEKLTLKFEQGSLLLEGSDLPKAFGDQFLWDERILRWRAPARAYRGIMLSVHQGYESSAQDFELVDHARSYQKMELSLTKSIVPRLHQRKALDAWEDSGNFGVVSLPTGAGKTILAVMAIAKVQRPTLVVVPTLDLVEQWKQTLSDFFDIKIGTFGGGTKEFSSITVATYHSAALLMEYEGHRFGFLVCDECHHLPAPHFQLIGIACLAPFRLGLSATVERGDGGEEKIFELLGPLVYEGQIGEMVNRVLAPYDVVTLEIPLTSEEQKSYLKARSQYISFLRRHGISMGSAQGWGEFVRAASFRPGGREAMRAFRDQKKIAQGGSLKIEKLWELLKDHWEDHILIFTNDNELAYRIGRELLLPVITHQTKLRERRLFLSGFREGRYRVLVTSKVLNEGVDVPEARVGIVVSGSSGVREHVQRLGRILRQKPGKRAILYEMVSKNTSENSVKERRRQHSAYQGST